LRCFVFIRYLRATDTLWHFHRHVDAAWLPALGDHHFFDRHEGSELRHQPVLESELRDRFFQFGFHIATLRAVEILAQQISDPCARPESSEHIVLRL